MDNTAIKSSILLMDIASGTNKNIVAVSPLQTLPTSRKWMKRISEIPFIAAYHSLCIIGIDTTCTILSVAQKQMLLSR